MTTERDEPAPAPVDATWPGREVLAGLCLIYGVLMLYSSTLVGPMGPHFVYQAPMEAFHRFLATPYVINGSDQRADWMSNMLMLIPFGFLIAGTIRPRRPVLRPPALIVALLICVATILAIKYLQLFFPPRTVTLNYIAAQTLGAVIGCFCSAVWHGRIAAPAQRRDPAAALVLVLRLYAGALLLFLLMPLDFALNAPDLHAQMQRLPGTLLALPGDGRPLLIRALLIAAGTAGFVPVGMLLTFVRSGVFRVRRGVAAAALIGLALTTGIFALATLVMGSAPSMGAILYRTAGIAIGAGAMRWIIRQDMDRLRTRIWAWVPWVAIPYIAVLIAMNRLWTVHWLSVRDAVSQAYPLGMLPLFDYYIVTKAEAAKNLVGHAVMYMPIGVGLWFRDPNRGTGGRAFVVGALLSLAVELGRYFRPGLQGDVNAVVVAGLSAMLAAWLMPMVWSMLAMLARQSAKAREYQVRAGAAVDDIPSQSRGRAEHS